MEVQPLSKNGLWRRRIGFALFVGVTLMVSWPLLGNLWLALTYENLRPINAGLWKKGVRIDYVSRRSLTAPADVRVLVRHGSRYFFLRSLTELAGLVQIRNGNDALAFVDVKSRYLFAFEDAIEQEIHAYKGKGSQTYYGPTELPVPLFKSMGLAEPAVHKEGDGFLVDRWILVYDVSTRSHILQRVNEKVTYDGHYQRTIIATKQPVAHPQVSWNFPGRE